MKSLGAFITARPRAAAAIAFGTATAVVTHFAWVAGARTNGAIPAITIGAGVAHALAGAVLGPRLVDRVRTPTPAQACLIGAMTSLIAVVIFAPGFALWIASSNARPEGALSYILTTIYVALFSFLGAGWALLIVSVGVAWVLFRLTEHPSTA